jgi:AcrR family transcriptional regulator
MVQKEKGTRSHAPATEAPARQAPAKRPRGRPRAYEPAEALGRALDAFWSGGYTSTSLDDLSAATGMNRPSLYAAFGDKEALYLETLSAYAERGRAAMKGLLDEDRPLREALRRLYGQALALYLSGERGARGCYLIGTAATEAVNHPAVRAALSDSLAEFDAILEARFKRARREGELPRNARPAALARLASAVMHSLAVRARAGESRAALEAMADHAVVMICGPR